MLKISENRNGRRFIRKSYSITSFLDSLVLILFIYVGIGINLNLMKPFHTFFHHCLEKESLDKITMDENLISTKNILTREKQLVFLGVLTTQKFIDTRMTAVIDTWATKIPGKVTIFTEENAEVGKGDVPLIRLKGVDDSYPPLKKAFMMLKFMYDHHLNSFEFFIRTDDDVYIIPERLEKFLRSINSSEIFYIGQMGKEIKDEIGTLSLLEDEIYCMSGPGIILSRAALAKVGPHIGECLKMSYSNHEDVEVGRCIQKFSGVPCTWNYEISPQREVHMGVGIQWYPDIRNGLFRDFSFTLMTKIMTQMYEPSSSMDETLKKLDLHRPITIHPIKNPLHMYRMHIYTQEYSIRATETEIGSIFKELSTTGFTHNISLSYLDNIQSGSFFVHVGGNASFVSIRPREELAVDPVALMQSPQTYSADTINPHFWSNPAMAEAINRTTSTILDDYYELSKTSERDVASKKLYHSFFKYSSQSGLQLRSRYKFLYKTLEDSRILSSTQVVWTEIPLGSLQIREYIKTQTDMKMDSVSNVEIVHFLLPLFGKDDVFQKFMENYKKVILETSEAAVLTIAHYSEEKPIDFRTKEPYRTVMMLKTFYPDAVINIVQGEGEFSRAKALQLAANQCTAQSLLFFLDVDLHFKRDILERIRMLTNRGEQVYFLAFFSEFNPRVSGYPPRDELGHIEITEESGYFRIFAFGQVSVYKSDLDNVGGFNLTINGWGREDTDLYEKFIRSKSLRVFRTGEESLDHLYHQPNCFNNYSEDGWDSFHKIQNEMCTNSMYGTFSSLNNLVRRITTNTKILKQNTL